MATCVIHYSIIQYDPENHLLAFIPNDKIGCLFMCVTFAVNFGVDNNDLNWLLIKRFLS